MKEETIRIKLDEFEVKLNKINIGDFMDLAKKIDFAKESKSYFVSYPEFLNYFRQLGLNKIERHHLVIGINFTYGWMPTTFDFCSYDFSRANDILNNAKNNEEKITEDELYILKKMFNNSLVGTSKLLHFISPNKYAIWDSRVYRYIYKDDKDPNQEFLNCPKTYLQYLKKLNDLIESDKLLLNKLKLILEKNINDNLGVKLDLSLTRCLEMIMFYNAPKKTKKPKK
jgi:hypothetical protein